MLNIILSSILFLLFGVFSSDPQSIYQFKVLDIEGKIFDFAALKGKKILIVNTASKCGYTSQYAELQELYDRYKDKNFVIVGFPSNDFMGQEPGSDQDIEAFCKKNYGVSFPMMSKISVTGKQQHPIYQFLTSQEKNGVVSSPVKWNFQKYCIDENGKLVHVFPSNKSPKDPSIISWIEGKNKEVMKNE